MQKITFIFKMLKYLTVLAYLFFLFIFLILFFFKVIILKFKSVIKRFIIKFNDERF